MDVQRLRISLVVACPSVLDVAGPITPPSPWTTYPAADGSQWRIDFADGATDAGRQAAIQALASYADPGVQPTVTGNQWAFALSSLGLSAAWQVGVTKSKASDQVRAGLIARDTPLVASDPLLIRIAANAGTTDGTTDGPPLIKVATVFSTAQTMPL